MSIEYKLIRNTAMKQLEKEIQSLAEDGWVVHTFLVERLSNDMADHIALMMKTPPYSSRVTESVRGIKE